MTDLPIQTLQIYRVPSKSGYPPIVPASADRNWMNITTAGWANRCLPLRIANEAGWYILNDCDFEVEWDGDPGMQSLHFNITQSPGGMVPFNMVGYGIVSWVPPYLFRTPAGINLWVRGPANMPKDGITPLEGIVETDWLPYTFTVNWKITRLGLKVRFEKGEPVCFITPTARHEAEILQPVLQNLSSNQELNSEYHAWHERRLRARAISGDDGTHGKLAMPDQGHYIRGEGTGGSRFTEHQTKLQIRTVKELELPCADPAESGPTLQPTEADSRLLLKAFNGTAELTDQDVIVTRRNGWRDRLRGKKEQTVQLPLKKIKAVQIHDEPTFTQMGFIRFVVGDQPLEVSYLEACGDAHTLLIDKPQVQGLREFWEQLQRRLPQATRARAAKA